MIDSSIGCATSKKFEKDVEGILKRHSASSFAMASLKINNFGYFAEKFGDEQKLKLKKFVAQSVRGSMHVGETFAYAGGGEFVSVGAVFSPIFSTLPRNRKQNCETFRKSVDNGAKSAIMKSVS